MVEIGQKAPGFTLKDQSGQDVSLADAQFLAISCDSRHAQALWRIGEPRDVPRQRRVRGSTRQVVRYGNHLMEQRL
ncbi:MAG: hypothetical protein ACXW1M_09445 [Acidimicrobiia bacterium]